MLVNCASRRLNRRCPKPNRRAILAGMDTTGATGACARRLRRWRGAFPALLAVALLAGCADGLRPFEPRWSTTCGVDKMSDEPWCAVRHAWFGVVMLRPPEDIGVDLTGLPRTPELAALYDDAGLLLRDGVSIGEDNAPGSVTLLRVDGGTVYHGDDRGWIAPGQTKAAIADMAAGRLALVRYTRWPAERREYEVPLTGFAAALAEARRRLASMAKPGAPSG